MGQAGHLHRTNRTRPRVNGMVLVQRWGCPAEFLDVHLFIRFKVLESSQGPFTDGARIAGEGWGQG